MFSDKDLRQIESRGSSVETAKEQVERFKKGFPWMNIASAATPQKGICVLSEQQADEAVDYCTKAEIAGKCKFVPASGAASRMFKDLFSGLDKLKSGEDIPDDSPAAKFVDRIASFAFYDEALFGSACAGDSTCAGGSACAGDRKALNAYRQEVLAKTLTEAGLNYGAKPKGVLKFHKYADGEVRTAIAEHLVEAQDYMKNNDESANLIITISPEHRELFEAAVKEVKATYEARYGVKYDIEFTYQDKATDTIAVDLDNKPFRTEKDELLFRPAGHGALIYNLNKLDDELVSIKNIDNVSNERNLAITARYKKVLMGRALELRDKIFGYLHELDLVCTPLGGSRNNLPMSSAIGIVYDDVLSSPEALQLCDDIEDFLDKELCIKLPAAASPKARVEMLRKKLDRPIRVCGMVRNLGEPGGGPFIINEKDGSTSLQILESVQINKNDAHAVEALQSATHFNPVDLVCCLRNYKGEKFNLLDHVDEDAGFISSKSYQGRDLKALELPGLWNGAMSDWNTLFVEVPIETFNPVKVVLDLLRPAHQ